MNVLFLMPRIHDDGEQRVRWSIYDRRRLLLEGWRSIDLTDFRPADCGRKNYAMAEALNYLIDRIGQFEIVCTIDADVAADLPALACRLDARFKSPIIGVLSGMRRFTSARTLPSAVRLVWQHYGQWLMWWADIPWGGCLAFRARLAGPFMCVWSAHLFDDTMAASIAEANDYRFVHDRTLFLEDDSVWRSWRVLGEFILRQMVAVRLYGSWGAVWASWLALLGVIALQAALPWPALLGAYMGVTVGIGKGWRVMPALVLAQVLHLVAVPAAQLAKRINWAGVAYKLGDFKA